MEKIQYDTLMGIYQNWFEKEYINHFEYQQLAHALNLIQEHRLIASGGKPS